MICCVTLTELLTLSGPGFHVDTVVLEAHTLRAHTASKPALLWAYTQQRHLEPWQGSACSSQGFPPLLLPPSRPLTPFSLPFLCLLSKANSVIPEIGPLPNKAGAAGPQEPQGRAEWER